MGFSREEELATRRLCEILCFFFLLGEMTRAPVGKF